MQYFRKSAEKTLQETGQSSDRLLLDVQATLLSYPGPALLVDSRMMTLSTNQAGEALSRLLSLGDEDSGAKVFRDAVKEATILDMPTETQIELIDVAPEQVRRFYDVSLLPCASPASIGNEVLVLARETTVDRSMMAALVRSRELYRDLLKCSSDFAWETDAEGRFEFISERGAVGYTSGELNHKLAEELLDRSRCDFDTDWTPFSVTFPISHIETWVRGIEGEARCLLVSAVPILDSDGRHTGTRGASVDVTELRRHERALAEAHRRDELVGTLLETIRAELEPDTLLQVAADGIVAALGADLGCVMTFSADCEGEGRSVWSNAPGKAAHIYSEPRAMEELLALGNSTVVQILDLEDRSILVCSILFGNEVNGGLILVRRNRVQPWNDDDCLMVRHIADQMGTVLARAAHAEALERLARVDPMTHLLNRRAFYADADVCLARNERAGKNAAYIYFDLDDFKKVNDTLGHGVGDKLLVEFSEALKATTRQGDLAVRLGGDEFGLLLDNCDKTGAVLKAKAVLGALDGVSERVGLPWTLSVSAGIAPWSPGSGQSIEDIMERADSVLYEAKSAGKNAWRVAPDVLKRNDGTDTEDLEE